VYPPIAKTAGVSGTVVLEAVISKAGTIENLRIVSGPMMLRKAAEDAVRTWRYRPYKLNNEPTEVETTINVIFSLAS
jgi:periplasmic protein TonB